MKNNLAEKIGRATKWSTVTELLAKLIVPLSNIILARLLAPEAFGVVVTITMITSFIEIFTDSGFQKYLIQKEFKDKKEMYEHTNIAFLSNLFLSFTAWILIIIFSTPLTNLIGSPGLEQVLIIACISLPLTSFSSIQIALYQRKFDYKTLFLTRMFGIIIPFVITIPLALISGSYWAIIVGALCTHLLNAVILTYKSSWKPKFFYKFSILRKMLSFSLWSMLESISVWLISWGDIFIIGTYLSTAYIGIYKTSMTTVNSIIAIVTSAILPILLSSLSRLQHDDKEYERLFFKFQRLIGLLVFPIGIYIYVFSDLITLILLGSQWTEASEFIGIWGLMSAIAIIFSTCFGIIYISKGKPHISFVAQILQLIVLLPVVYFAAQYSFDVLIYARSLIRIEGFLVHFILIYIFFKISPYKTFINIYPIIIASVSLYIFLKVLKPLMQNIYWEISLIFPSIILYIILILFSKKLREEISIFLKKNKN